MGQSGLRARGRGGGRFRRGRPASRTVRPRAALARPRRRARHSGLWRARAPAMVAGERRMFDVLEVRDARRARRGWRSTSPRARRCARKWSATSAPIRACSTSCRRRWRSSTAPSGSSSTTPPIGRSGRSTPPFSSSSRPTAKFSTGCAPSGSCRSRRTFASWKAQTLAAYQAIEPSETVWHLPDGRALARRRQPQPAGRRHLSLRRRHAELRARLAGQRAHARAGRDARRAEGGRRGVRRGRADEADQPRLRALWRFDPARAAARPHIDEVARDCLPLLADAARLGAACAATIVGLAEDARARRGRIERTDGSFSTARRCRLPDGATLITFFDATASANVERALTERNEALVSAEKLRNDFVNHVSYELRTPLTNIIGFTQLLADGGAGPLNPQADRICRLHQVLVVGAAGDHQRHSRSRLDRRRRAGAAARGGRRRRSDEGGGRGRAGSPAANPISTCASSPPTASACCAPTGGASGRSCSICSPMRSASRRRARR